VATLLAAAMLSLSLLSSTAWADRYDRHDRDRDDRYVLATTRGVSEMDVHPALKIPLIPIALLVDFVFFPFALLADVTTH
jgi:hypothetical protein